MAFAIWFNKQLKVLGSDKKAQYYEEKLIYTQTHYIYEHMTFCFILISPLRISQRSFLTSLYNNFLICKTGIGITVSLSHIAVIKLK